MIGSQIIRLKIIYICKGGSATALFYDDVRIPIYDSNGNNYRLNTFRAANKGVSYIKRG